MSGLGEMARRCARVHVFPPSLEEYTTLCHPSRLTVDAAAMMFREFLGFTATNVSACGTLRASVETWVDVPIVIRDCASVLSGAASARTVSVVERMMSLDRCRMRSIAPDVTRRAGFQENHPPLGFRIQCYHGSAVHDMPVPDRHASNA